MRTSNLVIPGSYQLLTNVLCSPWSGLARLLLLLPKNVNSVLKEPVTVQTIRNVLKEDGYKSYAKKKQPFLNARQCKARLAFAQKHKNWTVEDWKQVIWSDETKLNRFGSDSCQYCWKKPGEPLGDREVEATVKFRGGCMYHGLGQHGVEWGWKTCWGWGKDECQSVCEHFGRRFASKHHCKHLKIFCFRKCSKKPWKYV